MHQALPTIRTHSQRKTACLDQQLLRQLVRWWTAHEMVLLALRLPTDRLSLISHNRTHRTYFFANSEPGGA